MLRSICFLETDWSYVWYAFPIILSDGVFNPSSEFSSVIRMLFLWKCRLDPSLGVVIFDRKGVVFYLTAMDKVLFRFILTQTFLIPISFISFSVLLASLPIGMFYLDGPLRFMLDLDLLLLLLSSSNYFSTILASNLLVAL